MNSGDRIQLPVALALVTLAVGYWYRADFFGQEILAEVAIFAIFAMSLDLLVGYAGMVSLGHAAFLAVGAYTTAALTVFFGWPVSAAMPASVLAAGAMAALVGAFAVRLGGVFFIMITLAIGQIVFAYFFKAREFGGDNGMSGTPRFDLGMLGLDADESRVFAAVMVACCIAAYVLLRQIVRSPFGAMLVAIHQNESRLRSLGCPILRYKLAAFVLAGSVAGFAGSLMAQHTGFVSPDLAFWIVSGEVLIMVIVGGTGTLLGAAGGAAIFILAQHTLSDGAFWEMLHVTPEMADYWQMVLGIFFIGVVLLAGDGIYGRLNWIWTRIRARKVGEPGAARVSG